MNTCYYNYDCCCNTKIIILIRLNVNIPKSLQANNINYCPSITVLYSLLNNNSNCVHVLTVNNVENFCVCTLCFGHVSRNYYV